MNEEIKIFLYGLEKALSQQLKTEMSGISGFSISVENVSALSDPFPASPAETPQILFVQYPSGSAAEHSLFPVQITIPVVCLVDDTVSADQRAELARQSGGILEWLDVSNVTAAILRWLFLYILSASAKSLQVYPPESFDSAMESGQGYRMALKGFPVMLSFQDEQLKYHWIDNNSLHKSSQEILGKTDADILDYMEEARVVEGLKLRALRSGEGQRQELALHVNGGMKYYDMSVEPVRRGERVVGVACAALDITERKEFERSIQRAQDKAQNYLDVAEVIMLALDRNGKITLLNTKGEQILGVNQQDVLGKPWTAHFVNEDQRDETNDWFQRVMAGGEALPEHLESAIVTRKGESRVIAWHHVLLKNEDGDITGLLSSGEDITLRRQTEGALQTSRQELNDFIETASIGMNWIDADGSILWANQMELDILGYNREEYIGKNITQFIVGKGDQNRFLHALKERLPLNDSEFTFRCKDGTSRYFSINTTIYTRDGEFVHMRSFCHDITGRRVVEQALKTGEERYRVLVSATTSVVWTADAKGRFVFPQAFWEMYTGQSWEEHKNFGWLNAIHQDDRQRVRQSWNISLKENRLFEAEGRIWNDLLKEYRHFIARGAPILNPDDTVREWVGAVTDIHDRMEVEEQLKKREEEMRLITNTLPVLISYVDKDERYQFSNAAYERWLGVMPDSMKGKYVQQVLGRQMYERLKDKIKTVMTGVPVGFDSEMVFKDGAIHPIHIEYVPHSSSDGTVQGYYALISDLSNHRRAEETKLYLAAIVDNSHDAILGKTFDGFITSWNKGAEQLYGYTEKEMLGRSVEVLAPDDRADEIMSMIKKLKAGRRVLRCETVRKHKDGHLIDVSLTLSPIINSEGDIIGLSTIARDITQKKENELKLKRYREELELEVQRRTNELKQTNKRLIEEVVEHEETEKELKKYHAQLKDLSAYLQRVREEERSRLAREIHDELGQLLTVLKMDLTWIKKHAGENSSAVLRKIESMFEIVNLTIETVQRIASQLRPSVLDHLGIAAAIKWQAEQIEKHSEFSCSVNVKPEQIDLDQTYTTELFRIFQETLTNVARHSGAQKVHIDLIEERDTLTYTIRDDGVGIPPDKLKDPKSFGLIGMQERISQIGGTIEFKSPPNEGTIVKVTLPLKKGKESE